MTQLLRKKKVGVKIRCLSCNNVVLTFYKSPNAHVQNMSLLVGTFLNRDASNNLLADYHWLIFYDPCLAARRSDWTTKPDGLTRYLA